MKAGVKKFILKVESGEYSENELLEKLKKLGDLSDEERNEIRESAAYQGYTEIVESMLNFLEDSIYKEECLKRYLVYSSMYGEEKLNSMIELNKKNGVKIDYTFYTGASTVLEYMLLNNNQVYPDSSTLTNWIKEVKTSDPNYILTDEEMEAFRNSSFALNDKETFNSLFEMLPDECEIFPIENAKAYFLAIAIYGKNSFFRTCNVLELDEMFKPYIFAKNVTDDEIVALREMELDDYLILKVMSLISDDQNWGDDIIPYTLRWLYYRNPILVESKKEFESIISNWYDWL